MSFKEGERVFAKLSTYPYWPARINKLPNYISVPDGTYPIFFYGTHEVNFLSPKVILPFEENKIKFSRNKRYDYYEKAMWEIENNSDVLCLETDDTAEEFLCEAYGVVKPLRSPKSDTSNQKSNTKKSMTPLVNATEKSSNNSLENPLNKIREKTLPKVTSNSIGTNSEVTKKSSIKASEVSSIIPIEKPSKVCNNVPQTRATSSLGATVVPKNDTLLSNLEFSDDESEDMTPLYSKLITIAGSQENDKPDSSSTNHEAEALVTNMSSSLIKPCWVMIQKLSLLDINKATKVSPEYGPSTQLVSQQCVTTINKEQKVIDTIIIDSDDNNSLIMMPGDKATTENKVPDSVTRTKDIDIPRWPKPLFKRDFENIRKDKSSLLKKLSLKPKDKIDRKEKRATVKEIKKDVPLSFDSLFSKKFNILGSGMKIGKKVSLVVPPINNVDHDNESDESKEDVIDLVLEFDDEDIPPPEPKVEVAVEDDEDLDAEKWCKAQNWGNDELMEDIGVLEECNLDDDGGGDDDDDESNASWSKKIKPLKNENGVEMMDEDGEDMEFMDLLDVTRSRRRDKFHRVEENEAMEVDDVVLESKDDFVEDFEDGFKWCPPTEPEESNDQGKWFDVDKYSHCRSPPRFADLVEKKVIQLPEVEPVYTDRFYDLWADSKPRRNYQSYRNSSSVAPSSSSYDNNRFLSPYKTEKHSPPVYHNPPSSQRDPRVIQRLGLTQSPSKADSVPIPVPEKSNDVWHRHIESKTQQNQLVPQQNQFFPQQNQFFPQQNQLVPQQNQSVPQQNQFVPQQNHSSFISPHNDHGFKPQVSRLPSPGKRPPTAPFMDVTAKYHAGDQRYPPTLGMHQGTYPYPGSEATSFYAMSNLLYSDPRLFYSYYPYFLQDPKTSYDMFMNSNKAPVPYTPESPDPEMMDDYDPYGMNVKRECHSSSTYELHHRTGYGSYNPYNFNTYTPASPDPVSIDSPTREEDEHDVLDERSVPSLSCPPNYSTEIKHEDTNANTQVVTLRRCPSPEDLADTSSFTGPENTRKLEPALININKCTGVSVSSTKSHPLSESDQHQGSIHPDREDPLNKSPRDITSKRNIFLSQEEHIFNKEDESLDKSIELCYKDLRGEKSDIVSQHENRNEGAIPVSSPEYMPGSSPEMIQGSSLDHIQGPSLDNNPGSSPEYIETPFLDYIQEASLGNIHGSSLEYIQGPSLDLIQEISLDIIPRSSLNHIEGNSFDNIPGSLIPDDTVVSCQDRLPQSSEEECDHASVTSSTLHSTFDSYSRPDSDFVTSNTS